MKKFISTCLIFLSVFVFSFVQDESKLKTGDIVFISNPSGQGKAIQLATKSKYTHMGMVWVSDFLKGEGGILSE